MQRFETPTPCRMAPNQHAPRHASSRCWLLASMGPWKQRQKGSALRSPVVSCALLGDDHDDSVEVEGPSLPSLLFSHSHTHSHSLRPSISLSLSHSFFFSFSFSLSPSLGMRLHRLPTANPQKQAFIQFTHHFRGGPRRDKIECRFVGRLSLDRFCAHLKCSIKDRHHPPPFPRPVVFARSACLFEEVGIRSSCAGSNCYSSMRDCT